MFFKIKIQLFILKYLVYIKKFAPSPLRFLQKKSKKKIINIKDNIYIFIYHFGGVRSSNLPHT